MIGAKGIPFFADFRFVSVAKVPMKSVNFANFRVIKYLQNLNRWMLPHNMRNESYVFSRLRDKRLVFQLAFLVVCF
jgi:hypothetical protein